MERYDAIVVGGGVAGLSAGLWLARYRRRVLIVDSGEPRNDPTWAVHGYPGISDPAPHELRRVLKEQATTAGADWRGARIARIEGDKNNFTAVTEEGDELHARRIVLAFGKRDVLPPVKGIEPLYGKSVFHCPDCDGPSMLDSRLAVYGTKRSAALLALYLLTWAKKVTLLTDAEPLEITDEARAVLRKYDVDICEKKISLLCPSDDRLAAVEFEDGDALPLDGLFFHLGSPPASDVADQLGCKRSDEKTIDVDNSQETSVPGVYAAGDIIGPPYLAVSAAAKGVRAAIAVHKSLLPPDQEL